MSNFYKPLKAKCIRYDDKFFQLNGLMTKNNIKRIEKQKISNYMVV